MCLYTTSPPPGSLCKWPPRLSDKIKQHVAGLTTDMSERSESEESNDLMLQVRCSFLLLVLDPNFNTGSSSSCAPLLHPEIFVFFQFHVRLVLETSSTRPLALWEAAGHFTRRQQERTCPHRLTQTLVLTDKLSGCSVKVKHERGHKANAINMAAVSGSTSRSNGSAAEAVRSDLRSALTPSPDGRLQIRAPTNGGAACLPALPTSGSDLGGFTAT
ncbi:unnamed protein product [Pleuronectes platessa]|uniref:Uncharacterized protein n=1 Tax=Pleuronectes platessa TaxID=8262 RepID=A0A9N7Y0T4_PLEPL|nr:unnamed protein product [Pleuronectes platessa]